MERKYYKRIKMIANVTRSNHKITMNRHQFSKAMISFGAAAVGLPGYNLTDVTDVILKGGRGIDNLSYNL
ncbi:MAG: hypothetical protein EF812_02875 [Methanosarcinales archaeon]|nr:MAG: hypothetical protein EF812_02875 [Methanosarcinales archaeon]